MSPDAEIPSAAPRALQYHGKKVARYCLNFAQTGAYLPVFGGPRNGNDRSMSPPRLEKFRSGTLGRAGPAAVGTS